MSGEQVGRATPGRRFWISLLWLGTRTREDGRQSAGKWDCLMYVLDQCPVALSNHSVKDTGTTPLTRGVTQRPGSVSSSIQAPSRPDRSVSSMSEQLAIRIIVSSTEWTLWIPAVAKKTFLNYVFSSRTIFWQLLCVFKSPGQSCSNAHLDLTAVWSWASLLAIQCNFPLCRVEREPQMDLGGRGSPPSCVSRFLWFLLALFGMGFIPMLCVLLFLSLLRDCFLQV